MVRAPRCCTAPRPGAPHRSVRARQSRGFSGGPHQSGLVRGQSSVGAQGLRRARGSLSLFFGVRHDTRHRDEASPGKECVDCRRYLFGAISDALADRDRTDAAPDDPPTEPASRRTTGAADRHIAPHHAPPESGARCSLRPPRPALAAGRACRWATRGVSVMSYSPK